MRALLRRLTKISIGYGAIQWAGPFVSFFLTPIITRILNPDDYGTAEYILTISSALTTLFLFGIPQALMVHFNDHHQDQRWQRQVTGSALLVVVLLGAPTGVILLFFAAQIAQITVQDNHYTILFQLMGAGMILGFSNSVLINAAQSALRVRWGILFSLTNLIMMVTGNILFVIILRWGAIGLVLVPITTGFVLSAVTGIVARPLIGKPSLNTMKLLLRSGVLLQPALVAGWSLQLADRLILARYVSMDWLGYYTIANRIAALLYILIGPICSAWTPLVLATQKETQSTQNYASLSRYLIAVILNGSLCLGLFSNELLIVMTRPAYLPAAPYVGFLAYIHVFNVINTILSTNSMAYKYLKEISWANVAGAIVNIGLNVALIPIYGIWGATIATIIGYMIPPIVLQGVLKKHSLLPYSIKKVGSALLIHVGLLAIAALLPSTNSLISIGLKLFLLLIMQLAFLLLGIVTKIEVYQAFSFIKKQVSTFLPGK